MRRTRLAFAEGAIDWLREQRGDESLPRHILWEERFVDLALTVIDVLDPLLSLVKANRAIKGDLQLGAVIHAVDPCRTLRVKSEVFPNSQNGLLDTFQYRCSLRSPSLRGMAEHPENLPTRLRMEHPGGSSGPLLSGCGGPRTV